LANDKCIKANGLVQNVALKLLNCLLNQMANGQSFAATVIEIKDKTDHKNNFKEIHFL